MQITLRAIATDDSEVSVLQKDYPSLADALRDIESQGFKMEDIASYSYSRKTLSAYVSRSNSGEPPMLSIPVIQNLDRKILALLRKEKNILSMFDWHSPEHYTCNTTHCRGGWAIVLAGEDGRLLEERYGPEIAAALLYDQAYPDLPIPNFFTSEKSALADMEERAGLDD